MSPSDPLIGRQLANYRIERLLGQGGMASVYYGVDLHLHRPAAIKVMAERYRDQEAYTQRFLREARAMASWRHPNIPQVYGAGVEGELSYYAMEYVEGPDLERLIRVYTRRGELMPLADVLRIGRAVAEALDYAHRRGVIHRDVKPSNVLVSQEGRILLTDFGLILQVEQGTHGEVFGSPHYIAPEQARSSAAAVPQSDLYSLGVMLYQLLVGVLPFDDPSPAALALKHVSQPPPPPRQLNPALDPALEAALLKALSKLPEERFETGKELVDALEGVIWGRPPEQAAPPVTFPVISSAETPRTISQLRLDLLVAEETDQAPAETARLPARGENLPARRRRARRASGLGLGCAALAVMALLVFFLGAGAVFRLLANRDGLSSSARSNLATPTLRFAGGMAAAPTQAGETGIPAAPSPTPTATLEPPPDIVDEYRLLLVGLKDDHLVLINQGEIALPLNFLQMGNQKGQVTGAEWGLESLGPGQCVAIWKGEGKPKPLKGLDCELVGERLERSGPEKFWTEAFEVFYQGASVGRCAGKEQPCSLQFQGSL
jgi:tRNA A-37 threonylcarbamoyl transferase component Bud32